MSFNKFPPSRLLLVDDSPGIFDAFRDPLLAATRGRAGFLLHLGEDEGVLVEMILRERPDVVLLDGNLAGAVRGYRLVPFLKERQPALQCIGFSSVDSLRDSFLSAGAHGFVRKDADDPEGTLSRLADALGDLR